ncbi:MAG TPA: PqqD family peptide modification chaperone [Candidatus Binataceae bacterium]|nr:PqqD family peptide modification chaperone [Candidatus Binataceae bacterium]
MRITPRGIVNSANADDLRHIRSTFKRENYLRIPAFIEPRLLAVILKYLQRAHFEQSEYGEVGRELALWNSPVVGALHLLMNDPALLEFVRRISGCGPVGSFTGRLYRMIARPGMEFGWHSDLIENDLRVGVAMTINLGVRPYRGGMLQMRRMDDKAITEIPNAEPGDAIIFRLAHDLRHRVTPVEGKVPKTAFTGWFMAVPKYADLKREWLAGSNDVNGLEASRLPTTKTPAPEEAVSIPPTIVALPRRGETIIASIRTGRFYGLNGTASRMWELMATGRSLHRSALVMAREYSVDVAVAERDLIALAANLAARQLITLGKAEKIARRR